jgi:SPP1 gp7 family putative phage head morphogenesis protein
MSNPVTDFLWNINHEVSKLSGVSLSRVEEVLDAAEKELSHDLGKWLASHKGDDRFTPQVYRNALVQIRGTLDHLRNSTDDGMASALQYGGAQAAKLATSHLIREVMTFSQRFEHSVRPIAFEAASVIAEGKKTLWPGFKNSAHRYAGQVGDDIRKQLAIGLVRGETLDQLTDRLARLGGPKGYVYLRGRPGSPGSRGEMIAEGLFKRYRHWAERLAVTETVNAYNETAMIGMAELEEHDPGYYKRWDAAIDGRTCQFCKQYDDLVTPIDKPFEGGVDHPPLHPRCRCAVVVWRKEWDESHHKDDLIKETIKGREPKGVASIPHVIKVKDRREKPARAKPPKPVLTDPEKPKRRKPKAD